MFIKTLFLLLAFQTFGFSLSLSLNLNPSELTITKYHYGDKDITNRILGDFMVYSVSLNDTNKWKATIVQSINPGPCFFIPHDNEQSSFKSAISSLRKYGGSILMIESNEKRNFRGIDPNRNFYKNNGYTRKIINLIKALQPKGYPIITLHNNQDGWSGNGGKGTVSIYKKGKSTISYFGDRPGKLKDEDYLIYLASTNDKPSKFQKDMIKAINLNVKYEIVSRSDKSLSNFLSIHKPNIFYLNIESEHGDSINQQKMIDIVFDYLSLEETSINIFE